MSKKYVEVFDMLRVNELVELGYELHTKLPRIYVDDSSGRIMTDYVYTMGLKGKDYSDVVEVRDAPQVEANELLALEDGWEIASTSVSSKFYRMVKR